MDVSEIKRIIGENLGKYTEFWKGLCEHEGTAFDKKEMDEVVDFAEDFAREEGFSVRRIPFEKCGDFLIIDSGSGKDVSVFLAHLDTVHKIGAFGSEPVKIKDGIMYGPGVIDCKGGAAVAMLAMKAMKEAGVKVHTRLLLTTDEEISNRLGGEKEIKFFEENVKGFDCVLNCEVGRKNEAVVSRKGIMRCRVSINGKAAHSGIDYFKGRSALREAAHKIIAIEEQSVENGTTYNCSTIESGNVPNIVPEKCEFTVDIRVKSEKDMEIAEKKIAEIVEKSFTDGVSAKYHVISKRPPMVFNDDTKKLLGELNGVCEKYGYHTFAPIESGGGSDSAYTQRAGVPTLCALGTAGEGCHTLGEYAEVDSLRERAEILAIFCGEKETCS